MASIAAEPVPENMEAWFDQSNQYINTTAQRMYDMVAPAEWVDMYLIAVPTAEDTSLRFYYVAPNGTAYSGQRLDNPGIHVDGYIQRVIELAQPVRHLYEHFGEANMHQPTSIWIVITSDGKVNMKYNYDEDISDVNAYFDHIETTLFNNLVR